MAFSTFQAVFVQNRPCIGGTVVVSCKQTFFPVLKGGVDLPQFLDSLQAGILALRQLPADYPQTFAWYTLILRFLFPLLALACWCASFAPSQGLSKARGLAYLSCQTSQ